MANVNMSHGVVRNIRLVHSEKSNHCFRQVYLSVAQDAYCESNKQGQQKLPHTNTHTHTFSCQIPLMQV